VIGQRADRLKRGARDVVLHAFDISIDGIFINIEKLEKAGQGFVAVGNGSCYPHTLLGERGASIFDMGDKALGIQLLEHVGDTSLRDLQTLGDVDRAGVTFFLDEVEDLLEVVIAGGRATSAVTGAGSIGHAKRRQE